MADLGAYSIKHEEFINIRHKFVNFIIYSQKVLNHEEKRFMEAAY